LDSIRKVREEGSGVERLQPEREVIRKRKDDKKRLGKR
jgi:hypothetical protein